MEKSKEVLVKTLMITNEDPYIIFTMGKKNNILEGVLYTEQVAIFKKNHIEFIRFFGRGIIKKTFYIGDPIKIDKQDIEQVQFTKNYGYLWLDLMIKGAKVSLTLPSKEWKSDVAIRFIKWLINEFGIVNEELYNKFK